MELRVYQQKVKHLEYENKNRIKDIVQEGSGMLEAEQETNNVKQKSLLRLKEQLKFEQMELELVNASKVRSKPNPNPNPHPNPNPNPNPNSRW